MLVDSKRPAPTFSAPLDAPGHVLRMHVLRMSERQAQALAGLLLLADFDRGEGAALSDVYDTLVADGCEVNEIWAEVSDNNQVVVSREAAPQ